MGAGDALFDAILGKHPQLVLLTDNQFGFASCGAVQSLGYDVAFVGSSPTSIQNVTSGAGSIQNSTAAITTILNGASVIRSQLLSEQASELTPLSGSYIKLVSGYSTEDIITYLNVTQSQNYMNLRLDTCIGSKTPYISSSSPGMIFLFSV